MKMRHLVLAAVACVALPPLAATAATAPGESCQASEIYPQPPPAAFDRTANQPQPKQTAADLAKSLTALGDALQRRAQTDWADLCRYRAEDRALAASATPVRAVFLGDSITEYWRIADPALFSGGLVNRGIAGQTTPQILLRLRQDVIGLTPIAVVILAGTNDIMNLGGATTPGGDRRQYQLHGGARLRARHRCGPGRRAAHVRAISPTRPAAPPSPRSTSGCAPTRASKCSASSITALFLRIKTAR